MTIQGPFDIYKNRVRRKAEELEKEWKEWMNNEWVLPHPEMFDAMEDLLKLILGRKIDVSVEE